jgi:hypothetical protein
MEDLPFVELQQWQLWENFTNLMFQGYYYGFHADKFNSEDSMAEQTNLSILAIHFG